MNPVDEYTEADWQEAELLDYRADVESWSEVISLTSGPILELGCGVGRLARSLPAPSRSFLGIDRDPTMVSRFNERLAGSGRRAFELEAEQATALLDTPELRGLRFGLIMAPMHLTQTVDGAEGRHALLSSAAKLLQSDGVLALSVNFELPPPDWAPIPLEPHRSGPAGSLMVEPREIRPLSRGVEIIKARTVAGRTEPGELVADFLHRLAPRKLDEELISANLARFLRLTVPGDPMSQGSAIVLVRSAGA